MVKSGSWCLIIFCINLTISSSSKLRIEFIGLEAQLQNEFRVNRNIITKQAINNIILMLMRASFKSCNIIYCEKYYPGFEPEPFYYLGGYIYYRLAIKAYKNKNFQNFEKVILWSD